MTDHRLKIAPPPQAAAPPPNAAPQAPPAAKAAPQAPLPPALEALAEEVRGYADMKPGWHPYGGETPGPRAIENAIAFLALLPPGARAPDVGPREDGGVEVDWDRHRRKGGPHLGFAFMSDGTWGWFGEAPGLGGSNEEDIPFHPEEGVPESLRPWLAAVCAL